MNEETMRKHYERTPKDRLINILISARKEFNKLQNRNKEYKQEIERLNKIINEAINYIDDNTYYKDHKGNINIDDVYIILQKGSDK